VLVKLGKPGIAPLAKAANGPDLLVRREAAIVLAAMSDVRAIEPLMAQLKTRDPDTRQRAAQALVSLGKPAAEALVGLLSQRDDSGRQAATEILVGIGKPAVDPLGRLLDHPDEDVRRTALTILDRIRSRAI
jgi:HEAT repeat protein